MDWMNKMCCFDECIAFLNENRFCYLLNENLSKHTTFRIGGPAKLFVEPNNIDQIKLIVDFASKYNIRILTIGRGSNFLISDNGFDGIVLHIGPLFSGIEKIDINKVSCLSGSDLFDVCKFCLGNNLSGMEFAYGIPGSIGGFVYMNAGAYGGEAKDIVQSVTCLDDKCNIVKYTNEQLKFDYRFSRFMLSNDIILSAELKLEEGNYDDILSAMKTNICKRKEKQPLEYASAGSTFKRPNGDYAGRLIEQCGLKGYSIGDAQVSEKHSGFLINKGNASFQDMRHLIDYVIDVVYKQTEYLLDPEIKIIEE